MTHTKPADPSRLYNQLITSFQQRLTCFRQLARRGSATPPRHDRWDVLLCPVHNITAPHYSDKVVLVDGEELVLETAASPADLSPASGLPALVMPLSKDCNGLPIGVQLIGRRWADERLLAIAELISEVTGGFQRPPGY